MNQAPKAPRELELKFSVPSAQEAKTRLWHALKLDSVTQAPDHLRSTYFDDPAGTLSSIRAAIRVRKTPNGWVQTLKGEGETPFDRIEIESPVPTEALDPRVLNAHSMHPLVQQTLAIFPLLRPIFTTDIYRTTRVIEIHGVKAEVAWDNGWVSSGQRAVPIEELEIEWLAGKKALFFAWGALLARRHRLILRMPSKAEQGLRLAGRIPPAQHREAAPVPLCADLALSEAASATLRNALNHLLGNIECLLQGRDVKGTHQLRVALRRLDSAIVYYRLKKVDKRWQGLGLLSRTLARSWGPLRDLDVFEPLWESRFQKIYPAESIDRLRKIFRHQHQEALCEAKEALEHPALTALTLSTLKMAERLSTTSLSQIRCGAYAQTRFSKMAEKFEKRAAAAKTAEEWHQVRIFGKRLRYSLEFSQALFQQSAWEALVERVRSVSGVLGRQQDWLTQERLTQQLLASDLDSPTAPNLRPLLAKAPDFSPSAIRSEIRHIGVQVHRLPLA